jgi:hypothetical protein
MQCPSFGRSLARIDRWVLWSGHRRAACNWTAERVDFGHLLGSRMEMNEKTKLVADAFVCIAQVTVGNVRNGSLCYS